MSTAGFKDAFVRGLKPKAKSYFETEWARRNEGRLVIEVLPLPDGRKIFHFRSRRAGDSRITLGTYDPKGRAGITLAQAHKKADEQRAVLREHGNPRAHRLKLKRAEEEEARRGSLGDLCTSYVAHLKAAAKASAREVECTLELHVKEAFPKLWRTAAAAITAEDVSNILARLVKAKRTRQVNKLRSYLHAAFIWAAKSAHDPRTRAAEGKRYALTVNPVSLVPRISEYDRAGDRALTDDELAHYVKAIDAIDDVQGAALRFLLVLGCQRVAQVLRAPWDAYDFDGSMLLLRDPKGKGAARDHLLPLTKTALAILAPYQSLNRGAPGPLSSDGKRLVHAATLSKLVTDISATLHKKHQVPRFSLRDLRRTAETTMARLGVTKDVRAFLLSHGRTSSDVQTKHYDRYSYLPQKMAALVTWEAHLRGLREDRPKRTAKVVALGLRKRS
jgi:integrase